MTAKKFKFTKSTIESLDVPGYYYDTGVRALCIRVNKDGSKIFLVYRRFKDPYSLIGKPQRITLGRFPDLTIELARRRAAEINTAAVQDINPLGNRPGAASALSLEDLFDAYFHRHILKMRKQPGAVQSEFSFWFKDWRTHKASTISRERVEAFHAQLGEVRGTYAANRAVQMLRAIFNKAKVWGLIDCPNPASNVTLFKETPRERVLKEEEFASFFEALREEPSEDFRDFVTLALLTGQRKSNILGMRWQDVDLRAGTWRIPAELMKNSQSITIMLTGEELSMLERRYRARSNAFVFPGIGKSGHWMDPKKQWKRLLERAGIEDLHIHDLRRSLASYMANTGANVALIQNALNHKDLQTTLRVYARTAKRAEMEARQKAHERMFELGGKEDSGNNEPIDMATWRRLRR